MTPSGNDPSDGVSNVNPSPMDMTHLARTPDHGPGPSEGDLGLKIPPKTAVFTLKTAVLGVQNSCFGGPNHPLRVRGHDPGYRPNVSYP